MVPRTTLLSLSLALITLAGCGSPARSLSSSAGDTFQLAPSTEAPALQGLRAVDQVDLSTSTPAKSVEELARRAQAQVGLAESAPGRTNQPSRSDRAPATAPSSGAVAPSGPDDSSVQLPIAQNLGRMVIYATQLTLLTVDLDAFPGEVGTITLLHGGYVAGVEMKEEGGVPGIIVQLKVPPARYESAMRALRSLGVEVRDEKATTKDVTEEFSDVGAQVASLEATHAQLLRLMDRAGSIEEVLKVQQEANRVKLQIDRLKGRQNVLERQSEYATITAKAVLASASLQRDYTTVRTALRRADATRSSLEVQLKRARTPEEEATIRDKLGEVLLEITRLAARLADLEAKAATARVTLPTSETGAIGAKLDETLPKAYVETRVALRRAQWEQAEMTKAIRAGRPDADPKALSEIILRVNRLSSELRDVQQRASQAGIALPAISVEEEALLAGIAPIAPGGFEIPAPIRAGWEASVAFLVMVAGALVFMWWLGPIGLVALFLVRRRFPLTARTPAAEPS